MLDDFLEAKRGGICGILGDKSVNSNNQRYLDAKNLCEWSII